MVGMNRKPCKVFKYENGIILPQKKTDEGPLWGLGGVCDSEGRFVQTSFYDGGWGTHGGFYDWGNEEEFVDADAVYVGLYASHWGHFLVDMTTRLWIIPRLIEKSHSFKVVYLGEEIPEGNTLRFFELLGVKKEWLYHVTKPTRFRRIILPEQAFKSCEWYTKEYVEMLDFVVERAISQRKNCSEKVLSGKVYLSRRNFWKANGSEFGEEYFENLFNQNGYQSISPESQSLDEQIWIWNKASSIACLNGSIPLNVVFCRNKDLKLTILNKTTIRHENPYILLKMRGIEASFVCACKEPIKGYPKSLGEGPYLLWPTKEFDEFCEHNGLVQPMDKEERTRYFKAEKRRYYFAVIGIKRRARSWFSKHTPEKIKRLVRKSTNREKY